MDSFCSGSLTRYRNWQKCSQMFAERADGRKSGGTTPLRMRSAQVRLQTNQIVHKSPRASDDAMAQVALARHQGRHHASLTERYIRPGNGAEALHLE